MSSDPKDNESFFRKVVRFVANPTTDWHELNSQVMDPRESEYAKSELKAMIERKRRNDFVRKREFDMLRKIRREGIHAKGLADHPPTSQLDDTLSQPARTDVQAEAVRHKIDAIEKQMVGETSLASRRRLQDGRHALDVERRQGVHQVSHDVSLTPASGHTVAVHLA